MLITVKPKYIGSGGCLFPVLLTKIRKIFLKFYIVCFSLFTATQLKTLEPDIYVLQIIIATYFLIR